MVAGFADLQGGRVAPHVYGADGGVIGVFDEQTGVLVSRGQGRGCDMGITDRGRGGDGHHEGDGLAVEDGLGHGAARVGEHAIGVGPIGGCRAQLKVFGAGQQAQFLGCSAAVGDGHRHLCALDDAAVLGLGQVADLNGQIGDSQFGDDIGAGGVGMGGGGCAILITQRPDNLNIIG